MTAADSLVAGRPIFSDPLAHSTDLRVDYSVRGISTTNTLPVGSLSSTQIAPP